jgi:hypothetical protein
MAVFFLVFRIGVEIEPIHEAEESASFLRAADWAWAIAFILVFRPA